MEKTDIKGYELHPQIQVALGFGALLYIGIIVAAFYTNLIPNIVGNVVGLSVLIGFLLAISPSWRIWVKKEIFTVDKSEKQKEPANGLKVEVSTEFKLIKQIQQGFVAFNPGATFSVVEVSPSEDNPHLVTLRLSGHDSLIRVRGFEFNNYLEPIK